MAPAGAALDSPAIEASMRMATRYKQENIFVVLSHSNAHKCRPVMKVIVVVINLSSCLVEESQSIACFHLEAMFAFSCVCVCVCVCTNKNSPNIVTVRQNIEFSTAQE
jgi:hypothetical protein